MADRVDRLERRTEIVLLISIFVWPLAVVSLVLGCCLVAFDQVKSGTLAIALSFVPLAAGVGLAFYWAGT